jgi:hypothetical protein
MVDLFLPAHNLDSLARLAQALAGGVHAAAPHTRTTRPAGR